MLSRRVVSGFAALALTAAVHAAPASAGLLGESNVLTFGDFIASNSDVEGRIYAGGNVSLTGYSVGYTLSNPTSGGPTLVVGQNLNFGYGTVHGNTVVGGTASITSSFYWTETNLGYSITDNVGVAGLPVDFAAEYARLSATSATLALLGNTGTISYIGNNYLLTGTGASDVEVFNINAANLSSANELKLEGIASDATVIVNVSGSGASWSGGMQGQFEALRDNVIFNFYEADSLSLGSIGVQGSILAVNADITTSWGVIQGQVVAGSWNGPMQVNEHYFGGDVPTFTPNPTTEVPAPAAAGVMIVGLFAFAGLRRRRSAAKA